MHLNSCSALISFVPCEIIVTHLLGLSWALNDIIHVKYLAACLVHAKCSDNEFFLLFMAHRPDTAGARSW